MSLVAAGVIGIVVGYGLCLWRESRRVRDCERDCHALREHIKTRLHQDLTIYHLYAANERLARMIALRNACEKTRLDAEGS